jgi:hypothetical protein
VYGWIWRHLPGPLWARITASVTLAAAVCALLWFLAFPWAEPLLPFDDVQVGDGTGTPTQVVPSEVVPSDDVIPYPTHSNNPDPNVSPSVAG